MRGRRRRSGLAVIFFGLQFFASVVAKRYPGECSPSEPENKESSALPMSNSSLKGFNESLMRLVLPDLNNPDLGNDMRVAFAFSAL